MPNIAYLNGRFLPLEEAKVSIQDRGFQFGDGVYEVIRVYHGTTFRFADHLKRLEYSARAISISVPFSSQQWESIIAEGVRLSTYLDCKIYIQLTRGIAPREHVFPDSISPTVIMTIQEIVTLETYVKGQGVCALTLPDLRWGRCSIKSLNLLPNLLAKQQAKEAGAFEAILVRDGFITEGTTSNVMVVKQGILITPPLGNKLLAGVTRQIVLDLARKVGIPVQEREIRKEELLVADEIFLIGTTIEIVPVTVLDTMPVGNGSVGEVTKRVGEIFQTMVWEECKAQAGSLFMGKN